MSNKAFGYLFAACGLLSILGMIGVIIVFKVAESKIPEDAEWFDAIVSEVISVETDYEWKEDSDGDDYKVKVYDCKVYLEYEINGQTYLYKHTTNNSSEPLREGDRYYVKVSPSDPDKIYSVSNTKSNWGIYLGAGIFGFVGVIFVIVGLCIARSGRKKESSINNTLNTQMAQGNVGQPYNADFSYNTDQSHNPAQPFNNIPSYSDVGYNSQEYNNYDYYNSKQTTDYSGTSLKD